MKNRLQNRTGTQDLGEDSSDMHPPDKPVVRKVTMVSNTAASSTLNYEAVRAANTTIQKVTFQFTWMSASEHQLHSNFS